MMIFKSRTTTLSGSEVAFDRSVVKDRLASYLSELRDKRPSLRPFKIKNATFTSWTDSRGNYSSPNVHDIIEKLVNDMQNQAADNEKFVNRTRNIAWKYIIEFWKFKDKELSLFIRNTLVPIKGKGSISSSTIVTYDEATGNYEVFLPLND